LLEIAPRNSNRIPGGTHSCCCICSRQLLAHRVVLLPRIIMAAIEGKPDKRRRLAPVASGAFAE
jgi:hypothetical protein